MEIKRLIGEHIADRYCIISEIGRGGMGYVFRAMSFADPSQFVAIKVIQRKSNFNYETLLNFQKEAALMSQLHHPSIVAFYELGLLDMEGSLGGGYYIVMEIANGMDLKSLLRRDGPKNLEFFFQLAIQVTEALDYTHGKNIIHRDIKPQNIIVGRNWREKRELVVKILDFGVAHLAETMHSSGDANAKGHREIAGTPVYMAPEQSSDKFTRDHRMDLYSLGCVLYEILTGSPPFQANTRQKLIKQHLHEQPKSILELRPDVPAIVNQIIQKLLEKDPDKRYRSAFSLLADLIEAKETFVDKKIDRVTEINLGYKDHLNTVAARIPMAGRQAEMEVLTKNLSKLEQNHTRSIMTVLRGDSGIGKSRILAEFRNHLVKSNHRFVSGSFSQHENGLPFNALANAFNDYLNRISKSEPEEAEKLRQRFRKRLGSSAYQLAEVVPGIKPFLDEIQLDTEDDPNKFNVLTKTFSDFTKCLAEGDEPIIFILDNLHWADEQSLELIDGFFSNSNSQKFYLILSMLNNEESISPILSKFILKFSKLKRRFNEIQLRNLKEEATVNIVNSFFKDKVNEDQNALQKHIHQKTYGNPRFIVEYAKNLVLQRSIFFNTQTSQWNFNLERIKNTRTTLNTVELIISRIRDLNQKEREALEIASVVGYTFQYELLNLDEDDSTTQLFKFIQNATSAGIFSQVNEDKAFLALGKTYKFAHSKVRSYVYDNINPKRKRELHYQVGKKLSENIAKLNQLVCFSITHHFNCFISEDCHDLDAIKKTIFYNRRSCVYAKNGNAFESARRYIEIAINLLNKIPHGEYPISDIVNMYETNGDILILLRRHSAASDAFHKILKFKLEENALFRVLYKIIKLNYLSGIISKSVAFIKPEIIKIKAYEEKNKAKNFIYKASNKIAKIVNKNSYLKRIEEKCLKKSNQIDTPRIVFLIESIKILNTTHPATAKYVQNHLIELSNKSRFSNSVHCRIYLIVAKQEYVKGNIKFARAIAQIIEKASKKLQSSSLLIETRILLAEIYERNNSVATLEAIPKYLNLKSDTNLSIEFYNFTIFSNFFSLNFSEVDETAKRMPSLTPTRHLTSSKYMAVRLFAELLQNNKKISLTRAQNFITRRKQVKARSNDIFSFIIKAQIALIKGQDGICRQYFHEICDKFINHADNFFEYRKYEQVFILYFIVVYIDFYSEIFSSLPFRDSEAEYLYKKIKNYCMKPQFEKDILIQACHWRVQKRLDSKTDTDLLVQISKENSKNYNIAIVTALYWLRKHSSHFARFNQQYEDLIQAHKLKFFSQIGTRKSRSSSNELLLSSQQNDDHHNDDIWKIPSPIVSKHLKYICLALQRNTPLHEDITTTIDILNQHLDFDRALIIDTLETPYKALGVLNISPQNLMSIIEYLEPYQKIKSTLYLPLFDAPWLTEQHKDGFTTTNRATVYTSEDVQQTINTTDNEETQIHENGTLVMHNHDLSNTDQSINTTSQPRAKPNQKLSSTTGLRMNAIVPIMTNHKISGQLYLENISFEQVDSSKLAKELNKIGAHIGLLMSKNQESGLLPYNSGNFNIEPVDWINFWHVGMLRKNRENVWFLGQSFSPNEYVMMYASIQGDDDHRGLFSAMIWHEFQSLKINYSITGEPELTIDWIREQIGGILAFGANHFKISQIDIAFSIFHKDRKEVVSCHFGDSRPIVIGCENDIIPQEKALHFKLNNKNFQSWDIHASLSNTHLYLLSYNTKNLETKLSKESSIQLALETTSATSLQDHHSIVQGVFKQVPRYYLAAFLVSDSEEEQFKKAN